MSREIKLYDVIGNVVGSYVTLNAGKVRVFGLYKSFKFDEYILTKDELERVKSKFNLTAKSQTDIFEYM